MGDGGVVRVQSGHKVILQNSKAKLGVNNGGGEEDDDPHEAGDELQSGLDELHRAELSECLGIGLKVMFISNRHLCDQVECVSDIDCQKQKEQCLEPIKSEPEI